MSMDGAAAAPFACNAGSFSQEAPWIQTGHTYTFTAFSSDSCDTTSTAGLQPLASVEVSASESSPLSATPDPCVSYYDQPCTATIRWSSQARDNVEVFVSMDGAPAKPFSCNTGPFSQDASWIQANHTYTFSAYKSKTCAATSTSGLQRLASLGVTATDMGSNYVMWDLGSYGSKPTEDNWYGRNGARPVRPVIGTYNLAPDKIRAQLRQMYDDGQRTLSLMLWYAPLDETSAPQYVFGHIVDSSQSRLRPLHRANLQALLADIVRIGYRHMDFRFAPQGRADPLEQFDGTWSNGWNEAQYQQNWNFIADAIKTVNAALKGTRVDVTYDLSAELGGVADSVCPKTCQAQEYERRLWSDYYYNWKAKSTSGFSIAYQPGRVSQMMTDLNDTGAVPGIIAVDVYEGTPNVPSLDDAFSHVRSELSSRGMSAQPVLLQECNESDASVSPAIAKAKALGLNIIGATPWPNTAAGGQAGFQLTEPGYVP